MREFEILAFGLLGSLAGAAIGAVVGSQLPTEQWETANLEPSRRPSPEILQPDGGS